MSFSLFSSSLSSLPGVVVSLRDAKMANLPAHTGTDAFRHFTPESLAEIERRIEERRRLELEGAEPEPGPKEPSRDLEAGKSLPMIFGDAPEDMLNIPLEDIDPYFKDQKVSVIIYEGFLKVRHRFVYGLRNMFGSDLALTPIYIFFFVSGIFMKLLKLNAKF